MVDGLIRMMATPADLTGPINLGNPHEIAVSELAQIILRLTGSKSRLVFRPLPKDDPTTLPRHQPRPHPPRLGADDRRNGAAADHRLLLLDPRCLTAHLEAPLR